MAAKQYNRYSIDIAPLFTYFPYLEHDRERQACLVKEIKALFRQMNPFGDAPTGAILPSLDNQYLEWNLPGQVCVGIARNEYGSCRLLIWRQSPLVQSTHGGTEYQLTAETIR